MIEHQPLPPLNELRLRGLRRYLREQQLPWQIRFFQPDATLRKVQTWRPDAVWTGVNGPLWQRLGRPCVDCGENEPPRPVPYVSVDEFATGKLAARHLLERRLQHFACVGLRPRPWSLRRQTAFRLTLRAAGHRCLLHPGHRSRRPQPNTQIADASLASWLDTLPDRTGIFATNDACAFILMRLAEQIGRRVPDDLALIGIDDCQLDCEVSNPPLSSIPNPLEEVGYEATRVLHRQLLGEPPPPAPIRLQPQGVHTRQSTDLAHVQDPLVREAIALMRSQLELPLGVERIAADLGCSRSTLHRRFVSEFGRGVLKELIRMRLQRAAELLAMSELNLDAVAARCGFNHGAHLSKHFVSRFGVPPGRYRKNAKSLGRAPES